jgi:hypothetical protein
VSKIEFGWNPAALKGPGELQVKVDGEPLPDWLAQ